MRPLPFRASRASRVPSALAVVAVIASIGSTATRTRPAHAEQPSRTPAKDRPAPHAADDIARARALDQQGAKAYSDGRYNDAVRYFEEAYRLGGPPFELWNVAKCHLRLDQPEQAADMLERYLATADLPPDDRAEASQQLDELKRRPSTLTVASSPSGAEVTVDGKPEPTRTPFSVTIAPGSHEIALTLPNHATYTKRVEARYGRAIILDAPLVRDDRAPPSPPSPPSPTTPYVEDTSRRFATRADLGVVFPRYGGVGGDAAAGFFASGTYRLFDGPTWLAVGGLFFASGQSWRNSINAPTQVGGCSASGLRGTTSATAFSLYGIGTAGWEVVARLRVSALAGVGVAGIATNDVGGDVFIPSCTTSPGLRPALLVGAQVDYAITPAFRLSALPLVLQLQPAYAGVRTTPVDASGLWSSASIALGVGIDL